MPKYKSSDIAELAHQLKLSPRRQRLGQISGAQRLLELVRPQVDYPYDFVCFHLTGYRPLRPSERPFLRGELLISDLVRLIEHLSQSALIPCSAIKEQVSTQEELSERLSVSMKTIARWRQRGLSGLRVVDQERVSRLVFTERALRRFISTNRQLVLRGGAFKQLTDAERVHIVSRAREVVSSRRIKLQEVARRLAEETGRAVETIRYTLRRHDRAHPDEALFGSSGQPRVPDYYTAIYEAHCSGLNAREIARRFSVEEEKVRRVCLEMKAHKLLTRTFNHVHHPEFENRDAEQRILEAPEPETPDNGKCTTMRPPSGAPAYLKALYRTPLLTHEQERDLFRRYNYCKYRAEILIRGLQPCRASKRRIQEIEKYIAQAEALQNRLIKANLRLVVNIANRHVGRSGNIFELISDGNISLMRAVERFDFSRGFKFSTYASWAIMKNYARTVPEQRYRYARFVTGKEELLESAPETNAPAVDQPAEARGLREALNAGLEQLDEREREILTSHFGLSGSGSASTLEQLGEQFGVTKERIRQIEKRALTKLKSLLSPSLLEYIDAI